jgi:hypothetical protein
MACTIPPVRELVIVISDLYLAEDPSGRSPGLVQGQLESPSGAPGKGVFPGIEHIARFGARTALEDGWRSWLARWLGRGDLANVAPAVIAAVGAVPAAAVDEAESSADVVPVCAGADPAAAGVASAIASAQPAAGAVSAIASAQPAADAASAIISANSAATELPSDVTFWLATPVHLITGLTSLHLDRRSILRLPTADLQSFAHDFNRTFGESGLHLTPLAAGDFLMQGPATLTAATTEPARALVADLEASLPRGTEAKALKRLGAELEMWLHAHPLNETRRRRGELPVSTLWLWGGTSALAARTPILAVGGSEPAGQTPVLTGSTLTPAADAPVATSTQRPTPSSASSSTHATHATRAFGNDPYLAGLWRLQGDQTHALPDQLTDLLSDPHSQRTVLATEVTSLLQLNPRWTVLEALAEIDRRFVSPAIKALGEGAIDSVMLIANDTQWRVRRRDRLKLWRRPRPGIAALQT